MTKDWTGDSNSIYKTLGSSSHSEEEREENDFYATDPKCVLDLLERERFYNDFIWEPACGQGHISKELEKKGFKVYSSDLINRGYGVSGIDFLKEQRKFKGNIITNPPYKYAKEFVEKSMESILDQGKVCMFLKLQFIEGQNRKKMFEKYKPKKIYVYTTRQVCAKNGEFFVNGKKIGSAVCYCWYIWEKGWSGETILELI